MSGFPILAIIMLVMSLARADDRRKASPTRSATLPGPSSDAWDTLSVLLAPGALAVALVAYLNVGWAAAMPAVLVAALFVDAWYPARYLAIPLGWPRLAYALTRVSSRTWRRDRAGGAVFAGAWAAARRPSRHEAAERWVAAGVEGRVLAKVTGAMLAGHGLLAASRGDRLEARAFLAASLDLFDPTPASAVAREWLGAEAATRGAWQEIVDRGGPETEGVAVLRVVACHHLGIPGPRPVPLTPSAQAAQEDGLEGAAQVFLWPDLPPEPVRAALERHRRAAVSPEFVWGAARAWTVALRDEGDQALAETVVADLVSIARTHRTPASQLGSDGIGGRVADRIGEEWFERLELAVRVPSRRAGTPVLDEVRELLALRDLYLEAVAFGGERMRRAAFDEVGSTLMGRLAELYNATGQGFLFRAFTRWLRDEAEAVRHEPARLVLERNLAVSAPWK